MTRVPAADEPHGFLVDEGAGTVARGERGGIGYAGPVVRHEVSVN